MQPIRVDFYLLEDRDPEASWVFACRLLEKAYLKKHRVFVFCDNLAQAEKLDELLWTFKDQSFIPHNIQGEGPNAPPPIQIGFENAPRGFNDILLNCSTGIPSFITQFKRIMEIVGRDEADKEASRMRYREYRSRQYELFTHQC